MELRTLKRSTKKTTHVVVSPIEQLDPEVFTLPFIHERLVFSWFVVFFDFHRHIRPHKNDCVTLSVRRAYSDTGLLLQ